MGPCQSCQHPGQLPCSTPASRSELYYNTERNNAAPSHLALTSYSLSHPIRTARLARFGSFLHSRFRLYSPDCPTGAAQRSLSSTERRMCVYRRPGTQLHPGKKTGVRKQARLTSAPPCSCRPEPNVYMHRGEASVHSTDASKTPHTPWMSAHSTACRIYNSLHTPAICFRERTRKAGVSRDQQRDGDPHSHASASSSPLQSPASRSSNLQITARAPLVPSPVRPLPAAQRHERVA
ncbi:hypothetical protein C8Q74DRAFT_720269 [Fomes fomentarius]|nr:hypothetical protein C8Q74DRAFT_720269 [Fomes fomentarius]